MPSLRPASKAGDIGVHSSTLLRIHAGGHVSSGSVTESASTTSHLNEVGWDRSRPHLREELAPKKPRQHSIDQHSSDTTIDVPLLRQDFDPRAPATGRFGQKSW